MAETLMSETTTELFETALSRISAQCIPDPVAASNFVAYESNARKGLIIEDGSPIEDPAPQLRDCDQAVVELMDRKNEAKIIAFLDTVIQSLKSVCAEGEKAVEETEAGLAASIAAGLAIPKIVVPDVDSCHWENDPVYHSRWRFIEQGWRALLSEIP